MLFEFLTGTVDQGRYPYCVAGCATSAANLFN